MMSHMWERFAKVTLVDILSHNRLESANVCSFFFHDQCFFGTQKYTKTLSASTLVPHREA